MVEPVSGLLTFLDFFLSLVLLVVLAPLPLEDCCVFFSDNFFAISFTWAEHQLVRGHILTFFVGFQFLFDVGGEGFVRC